MFQFSCPKVNSQPEILRICKIVSCRSTTVIIKQTIHKAIKDSLVSEVVVVRMKCKTCGYSWRCYPEGIHEYSSRSKRLVFLGIMLYASGLSFAKASGFLASMLERETGTHMTLWRDVQQIAERLRRQKIKVPHIKGAQIVVGVDGTYVRVKGKEQPLLVAIKINDGTTVTVSLGNEWKKYELEQFVKAVACELRVKVTNLKIITDDLDMYKIVAQKQKVASHQICLGHVKKNLGKRVKKLKGELPEEYLDKLRALFDPPDKAALDILLGDSKLWTHPKKQCKSWILYRGIVGDLKRNWKQYTAYLTDPTLPTTNNKTEQAIGRSKVRYKTTRGFGSKSGALNFFTLTQHYGMKHYQQISSVC
jgi:transposase-like protein